MGFADQQRNLPRILLEGQILCILTNELLIKIPDWYFELC